MGIGIVPELSHAPVPVERGLNDAALHAAAAAVHEAHAVKPGVPGGVDVFLDDRRDIPRREGVQVEFPVDGNALHRQPANRRRRIAEFAPPKATLV